MVRVTEFKTAASRFQTGELVFVWCSSSVVADSLAQACRNGRSYTLSYFYYISTAKINDGFRPVCFFLDATEDGALVFM